MSEPVCTVAVNDVIQLGPGAPWPYVFAVVAAIKPWGVIADIWIPKERGQPPHIAPVRLSTGQYMRVGEAVFTPAPDGC